IRERAVIVHQAERRTVPAVRPHSPTAQIALATANVYLAYHALSEPRVRSVDYLADELVPQRAAEPLVAAHQLQIGVADACQPQPDQRFARLGLRRGALDHAQRVFIHHSTDI